MMFLTFMVFAPFWISLQFTTRTVKLELKQLKQPKQLKQTGTKTRAKNCPSKGLQGNSPFHIQLCGVGQNKQSILSELLWKDHAEYEMKWISSTSPENGQDIALWSTQFEHVPQKDVAILHHIPVQIVKCITTIIESEFVVEMEHANTNIKNLEEKLKNRELW